jgi:hypothetical protein
VTCSQEQKSKWDAGAQGERWDRLTKLKSKRSEQKSSAGDEHGKMGPDPAHGARGGLKSVSAPPAARGRRSPSARTRRTNRATGQQRKDETGGSKNLTRETNALTGSLCSQWEDSTGDQARSRVG